MNEKSGAWLEDEYAYLGWMLLSYASMEPALLEQRLPGRVATQHSPYLSDGAYNPLVSFVSVLGTCLGGFYNLVPQAKSPVFRIMEMTGKRVESTSDWVDQCSREALFHGAWWHEIRSLAQKSLDLAGIDIMENMPLKIDFHKIEEFPEDFYDIDYDSLIPPYAP